MERAVVFDLGGVLIDWNPRYLYRRLFDGDDRAMERFLSTVCTPEWNRRQDAGRSLAEGTRELVDRFPEQADLIRAYYDRWSEMIGGPIAASVQILGELRGRDTHLYALSNWSAETFNRVRGEFDFLGWFEGIVVSGEEGTVKPDRAIFRVLLDRYRLDPRATVYVDDLPANVEQARSMGMDGVLFRTPDALRDELRARDLLGAAGREVTRGLPE